MQKPIIKAVQKLTCSLNKRDGTPLTSQFPPTYPTQYTEKKYRELGSCI